MKNNAIIDKLINKYKKGEKIIFDEKFDEYIKNYNVDKHKIKTNTKVFFLLATKMNQEFQTFYDNYIELSINEQMFFSTEIYEKIKRDAYINIQIKYKILIDHHEQYKIINLIKKKYGYPPQERYIVRDEISDPNLVY
jgi:hypothetical protein